MERDNYRKLQKVMLIIVLITTTIYPLSCGAVWIKEFVAVDAALDAGASWDYVLNKPDYVHNHPFIPFSSRYPALVTSAAISTLIALVVVVALLKDHRRSSRTQNQQE